VCRPQPVDAPEFVGGAKVQVSKSRLKSIEVSCYIAVAAPRVTYCSPYGAPGDTLACKEQFSFYERGPFKTPNGVWYWADGEVPGSDWCRPQSPVTMPAWAVRHHPVITAVRLERVQSATTDDIGHMGIDNGRSNPKMGARHVAMQDMEYMRVWTRDNPRTPWDSNPWVWVYEVEGVKA